MTETPSYEQWETEALKSIRFAGRMSREDREDTEQEIRVALFLGLPSYRPELSTPKTHVFNVSRRAALDVQRKLQFRGRAGIAHRRAENVLPQWVNPLSLDGKRAATNVFEFVDETLGDTLPDRRTNTAAEAMMSCLSDAILREASLLPGKMHRVFVLRVAHGLEHKEVAEVMGLSSSRVQQIYAEAVKRLRVSLGVTA